MKLGNIELHVIGEHEGEKSFAADIDISNEYAETLRDQGLSTETVIGNGTSICFLAVIDAALWYLPDEVSLELARELQKSNQEMFDELDGTKSSEEKREAVKAFISSQDILLDNDALNSPFVVRVRAATGKNGNIVSNVKLNNKKEDFWKVLYAQTGFYSYALSQVSLRVKESPFTVMLPLQLRLESFIQHGKETMLGKGLDARQAWDSAMREL